VAAEPIRRLATGVPLYKVVRKSIELAYHSRKYKTTDVFSLYDLHYFTQQTAYIIFLHFSDFFTVSFEL